MAQQDALTPHAAFSWENNHAYASYRPIIFTPFALQLRAPMASLWPQVFVHADFNRSQPMIPAVDGDAPFRERRGRLGGR